MLKESSGLVDAHSHLRSTSLLRQEVPGNCLEEGLLRMNAMTSVDTYDDVLVAALELILSGVTGVQFIFHTFGNPEDYSQVLDDAIRAIHRSGIRALVILAATDQDEFTPQAMKNPVELPSFISTGERFSAQRFAQIFEDSVKRYPDVNFGIGPVGPQWCSDELLGIIGEVAGSNIRVHTHFHESKRQRYWAAESPLQRMKKFNLLRPLTSLAHAIWLDDLELRELKEFGVQLVTCPESNNLLNSGSAAIQDWISLDISFGIGLDSTGIKTPPISVAGRSMNLEVAERALIHGGRAATDLAVGQDRVIWSDFSQGQVLDLWIKDKLLISNACLIDQDLLEQARFRIEERLVSDGEKRKERQIILNNLMPSYLRSLDQFINGEK